MGKIKAALSYPTIFKGYKCMDKRIMDFIVVHISLGIVITLVVACLKG